MLAYTKWDTEAFFTLFFVMKGRGATVVHTAIYLNYKICFEGTNGPRESSATRYCISNICIVVVVVVFTLKTVLTSIQYPSLSYSSRQRNEFPW